MPSLKLTCSKLVAPNLKPTVPVSRSVTSVAVATAPIFGVTTTLKVVPNSSAPLFAHGAAIGIEEGGAWHDRDDTAPDSAGKRAHRHELSDHLRGEADRDTGLEAALTGCWSFPRS